MLFQMSILASVSRPSYLLSLSSIRQVMAALNPTVCNPTIEHCVPQSYYHTDDHQRLARDMHALICLPGGLNSQRSNYKLVEEGSMTGWEPVGPDGYAMKHERRRLFVPPIIYRGPYARSVGYFALTYPEYAHLVHARVLDFKLLVQWSELHPATYSEKVVHETIASLQNNANPFLVDPVEAQHSVLELL